ncbi:MAG: hypothetical protein RIA98_01500 [Algiphilus sp.]|uniref:hypothetical protein n=1 Tax=Algiphilus sp. TaxID=1872431 RepID=UPI0032EEC076
MSASVVSMARIFAAWGAGLDGMGVVQGGQRSTTRLVLSSPPAARQPAPEHRQ